MPKLRVRIRRRRLLAICALIPLLAPGTWLRSPLPPPDNRQILTVSPLPASGDAFLSAACPVSLRGAWHLDSPNDHFGGYSALTQLPHDRFLAGSDRGGMLIFASPDRPVNPVAGPPVLRALKTAKLGIKQNADLEALTRNPPTGQVWGAYEHTNSITRYDARLREEKSRAPAEMRDWPSNRGPEAITRLRDGRFIVLAESPASGDGPHAPGLLFPGDPVEGGKPVQFRFAAPDGMHPVDAATLPDGRVVILLRSVSFGLPPRFHTRLMLADPATIRAGEAWAVTDLATLDAPDLRENYEGLAIERGQDGAVFLWLIADDNTASFQRTLLLKLEWNPTQDCQR